MEIEKIARNLARKMPSLLILEPIISYPVHFPGLPPVRRCEYRRWIVENAPTSLTDNNRRGKMGLRAMAAHKLHWNSVARYTYGVGNGVPLLSKAVTGKIGLCRF